MRLIDCNETLRKVEQIPFVANENKAFHEGCRYMQKKVLRIFHEAKSVDAEPVRHGHWDEWDDTMFNTVYRCSVCGEDFVLIDGTPSDNLYSYCPNCGAKMDGSSNEE